LVTRNWRVADGSPVGDGTWERIASKRGCRFRPAASPRTAAVPARAFVIRIGKSSWSSVASRSMKRS